MKPAIIVLLVATCIAIPVAAQDIQPLSLSLEPTSAPSNPASATTESATTHGTFVEYFAKHFSGHEPVYFLYGTERPNVKFQFSFKYQILNPEGSWTRTIPPLGGLHFAYSQTSFWDLDGISQPFYDSSYRPEILFSYDDFLAGRVHIPGVARLGLQTGVQHESNGKAGVDSRSLNIAYVRPVFVLGNLNDAFLTIAPRVFAYVGDLSDNPDIADYRGHADLRVVAGWNKSLQLAAIGRLGDDWDKGSLQLDLTYPLSWRLNGNMDIFLHAQYFTGYGESLLHYNDADNMFRVGISLVR